MKSTPIVLTIFSLLTFSCNKKEEISCIDVKYEINSNTTTIDSIDFRLAGNGSTYLNPDDSRFYTNLNLPHSEEIKLCKDNFDYNLRCYDSDSSIELNLKIFKDGLLKKQLTSSPNNMVELSGGINE